MDDVASETVEGARDGFSAPLRLHTDHVRPEWIDSNGHMNLAYYVVIFDHATDKLFEALGIGRAYKQRGLGTFVVETHTLYDRELLVGAAVIVSTVLLGADGKRLQFAHEMLREDGERAAFQELMVLHIDMSVRRSAPFPADRRVVIDAAVAAHRVLARPHGVGRRIAMNQQEGERAQP